MERRSDRFVSVPTTRCTFYLEGVDAESVAVLGSFNEWSTTRHLMRHVKGRWEAHLDIAPGRHSYCFFVIPKGALRGTLVQIGSTIDVVVRVNKPADLVGGELTFSEIFDNECLTSRGFAD